MVSVSSYNREKGCSLINFTSAIYKRDFLKCTVTVHCWYQALQFDHPIFIILKYYGNQIPKLSWVLALQQLPPQYPMFAEMLEASGSAT
jgi:hypothetical protein